MFYENTTALVTGASSGIGREFARRLAQRGANLVIVARRVEALDELAAEIRAETGRTVHLEPLDLSVVDSGQILARRLTEQAIHIDTVVNCAGMGLTKPFAASTQDEVRQQMRLDIDALVDVCHAFLPQLLRSGRGALINVGSLTGYMPVPGMAIYAAAKAFVIRFTEALSHEVRGSGLTVLAVSPGPTQTQFYATSRTSEKNTRFQTPEQVVTTAFKAIDRPTPPVSVISGTANRWTSRLITALPRRCALRLLESKPATN